MHDNLQAGHSGIEATCQRIRQRFYWRGMKKNVQDYIHNCHTCQQCKYDAAAYPGKLQPLPIPNALWTEVSMDFIDGLPKSMGNDSILVVVDRLSKSAHFVPLKHPYSAATVAQAYFDFIYKLHGMPQSIVSDRDTIFMSNFWQELFAVQGVNLSMSSAYHPQSDGQTEVINRCLETYLRCFCHESPTDWCKWLPAAEYWYNTSYHTSLKTSPYEVLYGQPPPIHIPYLTGDSKVEAVERCLIDREEALQAIKLNLARAQNRMRQQADKKRSEREFEPGDYVYLKLQPYRQVSISHRSNQKLARKYYGPYKILNKVGPVAYKLELPPRAKIHHTFHVSLLKRCYGVVPEEPSFPIEPGALKEPELILAKKTVKRGRVSATKVLVKWSNSEMEDATWEFLYDLLQTYPNFNPWGQGSLEGRGNDASQESAAMNINTEGIGAKWLHSNVEGINCKKAKGGAQEVKQLDNHMGVLSHEGLVIKEALMTAIRENESVGIAHGASTI